MASGPDTPQNDPTPPTGPRWEEAGGPDIPPALVALQRPLPEQLFVLYDPRADRYCYRRLEGTEDCGLVCFADPRRAGAYVRSRPPSWSYVEVRHVSLDQAHAMARGRHAVVNCLIFVAGAGPPHTHYVR